ncbi:3-hydroxyacyl-CoA dehydrogenase NAD-binding domain-containing protein [Ottowia thiooxydans]|uniref:3-hydroxyacyl-CoA dehydrogenase NAD-binding domain-containing protein n=1 Tax=Ottowia thiooxydans TaxID=219182 RepID=UPI000405C616|nr:3-hydroxyacyl-CoA dehydrogenase NAD-binding domain-containing protein [Ottowia thiooxydans]
MNTIRTENQNGIVIVTFDEPNSPVNTMGEVWQSDMDKLAEQLLAAKAEIRGIVLVSAKNTFFAGADLKGVMRMDVQDAPRRFFTEIERIKRNFRTIETLGKPIVTCLNGAALGGGWEVALLGHYRIAVDDSKIRLGLPEVGIGLLPGGGGITKMTRLLGLVAAQPYLLESKLFDPAEAHRLGLVHELAGSADQLISRAKAWIESVQGQPEAAQHPWERKDYRMPGGTPSNPKIAAMLPVVPAVLKQKTKGLYPAPQATLSAMVEGAAVDFDTAMRIESRYLASLLASQVTRNMINTFFFNLNAIKGGQARPKGVPKFKPQKVGILGAGMMGAGIAWAQASRGITTVLKDVSVEKAEQGKAYSQRLADKRVEKGRMSDEARQKLLAQITATGQAADLQGCDLIVEAVFEQRDLKAAVTQEAEPMLGQGGFFASNTSTLPISGLAHASKHPEKFIGIHFFSPVDKMQLVEIIRGQKTDDETVARAYDYVLALGKLPIVVNDSRGFYTSRTFGTYVMEGAAMVGEGIPAPVIENVAVQAGMPVGPLAVLDETALSLSVHVLDQTRADLAAEGKSYSSTPGELLVERMVKELKRPGRAGGGGFYDYPQGGKKHLWPQLKALFEKPGAAWDAKEVKDRLLYRQSVETARCLAEGVLTSVHEANVGSIFGIGFPGWTGGAMQFIYGQGVEAFEQRCAELAARHGDGFYLSDEVKAAIRKFEPKW